MIYSSNCCGCGTCALVCPKNCISVHEDIRGFKIASVNTGKCVDCHRCEQVCPMINQGFLDNHDKAVYAAYSYNKEVHYRGSSGGLFETLSKPIIDIGGVVYACRFDSNLKLRYFQATSMEDVKRLCKSKYIQADLGHAFIEIRELLDNGKTVLFCGTPCYVAALKKFLIGHDVSNLYLVDFFCHGVPSQAFFDKCLRQVEKKNRIKIKGYDFRVKVKHVHTLHNYSITYQKQESKKSVGKSEKYATGHRCKTRTRIYIHDPFYLAFQKYLSLRGSCYGCRFGSGSHRADITIGDFHEINNYVSRSEADKLAGVSTVICNTAKGESLFNSVKDQLWIQPFSEQQLIADGQIWQGGTKKPISYEDFWYDYGELPFDDFEKKWMNSKREWHKLVYYHLPRPFRTFLKKIVLG